jgi:hypothetical protein
LPARIGGHARTSAELLFGIGANPQQRGYDVLRDGVRVTAEQMRRCRMQPLDALFPLLGTMCGRTDARAGQEMRCVIRACWDRQEMLWTQVPFTGRPSASEAVYVLAEYVRDRLAARTSRK